MIVWMHVSMKLYAASPLRIEVERRRTLIGNIAQLPIKAGDTGYAMALVVPRTEIAGAIRSIATAIALRISSIASRWDRLSREEKEQLPQWLRKHLENTPNRYAWKLAYWHDSDRVHHNKPWPHRHVASIDEERKTVEYYASRNPAIKKRIEHVSKLEEYMGREEAQPGSYQATALCPLCSLLGSQATRGKIKYIDLAATEYTLELIGRTSISLKHMTVRGQHVFYETLAMPTKTLTLHLIAYQIQPGTPEALLLGLTLHHITQHGIIVGKTKTVGRGQLTPASQNLQVNIACTGEAAKLLESNTTGTHIEKTLTITSKKLLEALATQQHTQKQTLPENCYKTPTHQTQH